MKRTFYAFALAQAEAFPELADADAPPEEDELLLPLQLDGDEQQIFVSIPIILHIVVLISTSILYSDGKNKFYYYSER